MRQETPSASPAIVKGPRRKRVGLVAIDCQPRPELVCALRRSGLDEVVIGGADSDTAAALAAKSELDAVIVCGEDPVSLLAGVRETRTRLPASAVIVVWPTTSPADPRRVFRAGADGLVSNDDLERELGPTIRAASAGLTCVPLRYRAVLDAEALSMREKQILGMLVRGFTNAEIATKLFLAESTVKSHLSSAYAKLGVRSRQAAASMILDPDEGLGPGILAITAA